MHDTKWVGLRRPAVVVQGACPVALAGGVNFVDRDDLTLLWLGQRVAIVEAPPGCGVAAEGLALT